ncbi:MAG: hypothetical protein V4461_11145 [Pseudomonadota bacterium]
MTQITMGAVKLDADASKKFMLSTGQVDSWVKSSNPGDVLLYARQPVLPQKAVLGEHVRAIAERGLVSHEPQRRCAADKGLFEYRVRRTGKAVAGLIPAGGGARGAAERMFRQQAGSPLAMQILDIIADAAAADEICPAQQVLSVAVGHSIDKVRRELARLRAAGELVLEYRTGAWGLPRQVAILPRRGLTTAIPTYLLPQFNVQAAAQRVMGA